MVDPSLFTLPYDQAFCAGLAAAGAEVTLVGRPLRPAETLQARGFAFAPLFYRHAESRLGRSTLGRALKGVEHAAGLLRLARLARRQRPDVIHLQWLVLPPLDDPGYARLARYAPLVFTAHNSVAFHGSAARLQRLGHDRALRRFGHYVAHTEPTARHLVAMGLPRERITVLDHPPLTLDTPAPAAASRHDGITRILLFGALKPYKGIDLLVRAGIELAQRRQDFEIVIAGQPFMKLDGLQAEIAAAGAAGRFVIEPRFLAEAELAARLAAADLVVFPYREIDASGALALAAGLGKPILASSVGVFAQPPAAGLIGAVPPGDVPALAAALELLVADPLARARLAEGSRRLASSLTGWPAFAEACLGIYRRLPRPG